MLEWHLFGRKGANIRRKWPKSESRHSKLLKTQGDGVTAYLRRRRRILRRLRSEIACFQGTASGYKGVGRRYSDGLDAAKTASEAEGDGVTVIR